jgi:hypothetical protein
MNILNALALVVNWFGLVSVLSAPFDIFVAPFWFLIKGLIHNCCL